MWLPGRSPVNCSYPGNMGWACMKGTNALQETKAPVEEKHKNLLAKKVINYWLCMTVVQKQKRVIKFRSSIEIWIRLLW